MSLRTRITLVRLWLLTVMSSLGCGPFFESAQFGWSTTNEYVPRHRSASREVSFYLDQLLSAHESSAQAARLPDTALPLEIQAQELRWYLTQPKQRRRATALLRLALIETLGAAHPEQVGAFIRSELDTLGELLALPLADFAAVRHGWAAYVRGDYAGALAHVSGPLEDDSASGADPHLRYLEARTLSRLDPTREAELFETYLATFPASPWAADARGWYAHGLLHLDRCAEALEQYAVVLEDPAAAHLHASTRRSVGPTLWKNEDRSVLAPVLEDRPWLGAAIEYFDTHRELRRERDPVAARAGWEALTERVRQEYGHEPPDRVIELAAIHAYEHGDYDGAIRLWQSIDPWRLDGRSMRYYGIALAAQSSLAEGESLELAAKLRSSATLSSSTERWILGEMGRRLLESGRKIDAVIAFNRGGFTCDWSALVDTGFSAQEIRRLCRVGRTWWPDIDEQLDLHHGRQLAREGRFAAAADKLERRPGLANKAREIDALLEAYEHRPSAESAFQVAEAFYSARPLLQESRHAGWRSGFTLGYQRLGLTNPDYGRANNYWTAIEWFDHVRNDWPDHPLAADALYWSAICAFWTSDIDWYWATMDHPQGEKRGWIGKVNPRFIADGAERLRQLIDECPDFDQIDDAERRLDWAERTLAAGR